MASRLQLFVATVPGLEGLLSRELARLGVPAPHAVRGGVEAVGELATLWDVALQSRLAESVRLRLRRFHATTFQALMAETRKVAWHAYLPISSQLGVRAVCHKSKLYHSDAVAERVTAAISDARRLQPTTDGPQLRVHARLDHDRVTLSLDATGERLHRRGFRGHVGAAPLRETLAAALLELGRVTEDQLVWDPFCGSGTILLEHALRAAPLPAPRGGDHRRFAFENFPTHDGAAFAAHREARTAAFGGSPGAGLGSDVDPAMVVTAGRNIDTLPTSLATGLRVVGGDFRELAPDVPRGAAVVTNPPYGARLKPAALRALFDDLEALLERRDDLRPAVVLCGDRTFLTTHRLPWRRLASFPNGGLSVTALGLP